MSSQRGVFLCLDGPDGTGKSTQCRLLVEWLRTLGHTVVACADPGGSSLGTALRELLLERRHAMSPWSEALLFMASRAQLVSEVIQPALQASSVVICDRYLLSTVVYQGHAGGLDPGKIWEVGRCTAQVEQDLTLVLDVPVQTSLLRRRQRSGDGAQPARDRFESRDIEYQTKVHAGFLLEASRDPQRIKVIDATPEVAVVQAAIRREVVPVLQR